MVNKSLVNFIKENLSQGYDAVAIRNHLIKSGFEGSAIDEAFNAVYQKKPEGKKINGALILVIVITLLIAAGVSIWFLFPFGETDPGHSATLEINPPQGCFNGVKDVHETGIDCGGPCKQCVSTIPRTPVEPATEGGSESEAESESESESERENPPLPVEPTNPSLGEKPSWEILREIHDTALVDPEKAGKMCDDVEKLETKDSCLLDLAQITKNKGNCDFIKNENDRDGCFASVAELSKDSSICEDIEYADLRDSCYMDFILNGDYSLCDKIVTDYYQNACKILRS